MKLRPGSFLQDRYEILEQIGSGGMSTVYKAKCHKLNRMVAIKVLKEEFSSDMNFVSKFKMEAQAAAGLSHPNIVSVYDVIDDGKLHYIVMELIEGITLKTYISRKGRLNVKESIGIAIQVAQGIAAAHEQHIIHRDIKPQNMLISRDGKVKVADFGIAKAVSAQTMNSAAMGSVHYISPEQARGGFSDIRSDLYSLGITMYEMVTGRLPYVGDNTISIALAHLEAAMVPPSVYNPEIPISLEQIILKCSEKKPERRYSSAEELISDLRQSLLHPSGQVARETEEQALKGKTVKIDSQKLAQMKEQTQQDLPVREYVRKPVTETASSHESVSESQKEEGRNRERQGGIHDQIEKLLAGVSILAAVLLAAVLIFVFAKLGGVFQPGQGETLAASETAAHTEELKDTEVYMPDVLELPEDLAEAKLKEHYLSMKRTYEYSDQVEKGCIISQDPEAFTVVSKWSHVNVVVSRGSDKIDLSGMGLEKLDGATAQKHLENKNLTVQVIEEESDTVEAGYVLRYEPQLVAEGGTVSLYVSKGSHVQLVPVPALAGKPEEEAIALIAEAGLQPGETSVESSDTVPKGYVISQSGGQDGMIEPGGLVNYVISSGPQVVYQRYVASINDVYDLSYLIGPGAGSTSVTVMVRLHQETDGEPVYKELTGPQTFKGDVLMPISYTSIESINGTDQGEVEVVDVDTGAVLKSYPLTFFPMD